MQPEKLDLSTTSISEGKMAALRDLLPEVFHEGKINFDELRNALGDYVEDDPANERFGLRWPGKSKLQQIINTPSVGTLVPQPDESVDWDTTGNMIIEGDNLEVLKLLQKSYAGKVKMIYIDPPYNTGNDFVYPDKYASGLDTYLEFTGQTDENGWNLATNTDTSGRYHANWLNMTYPRLYLARNLLREDGVIFVSIDDTEMANLQSMCNYIFGLENFVGVFVWKKGGTGKNDSRYAVVEHEYVIAYSRSSMLGGFGVDRDAHVTTSYNREDERGRYSLVRLDSKTLRYNSSLDFSFEGPDGAVYSPEQPAGRERVATWRWSKNKIREEIGNLVFERGYVYTKNYEKERARPRSLLADSRFGVTRTGRAEAEAVVNHPGLFSFPKPVRLISHFIGILDAKDDNSIILDFFAGSGTTGHAVMQQNAEDGGNRKFILVQLPEPMEPKTLDDGTVLNTIADVCRERVRRAGRKIAAEASESASHGDSSATPLNDGGVSASHGDSSAAPLNDSGMSASHGDSSAAPLNALLCWSQGRGGFS